MASPTPKPQSNAAPPKKARVNSTPAYANSDLPEVVDPVWIVKALLITLAAGLVCAWITVCLAFRYTQWQYVLHPSAAINATPATLGLAFTELHFGVDATGQPQLDGWQIPAISSTAPTALLLHGGEGNMADALSDAQALHAAGLSVLLFDYRGYGRSGTEHPNQVNMETDGDTALDYLRTTLQIPANEIFVYGTGVGGSLAVHLCAQHHGLAGLILDTPDGDFESRVAREPSTRLVPVSLLFHQRFPLADPLHTLAVPKLLLSHTGGSAPEIFLRAGDPKITVEVPADHRDAIIASIHRFIDGRALTPQTLYPTHP